MNNEAKYEATALTILTDALSWAAEPDLMKMSAKTWDTGEDQLDTIYDALAYIKENNMIEQMIATAIEAVTTEEVK